MNVASLELCRKLYELSGWDDTDWFYDSSYSGMFVFSMNDTTTPAYSLGYLLRKLPKSLNMTINKQNHTIISYMSYGTRVAQGKADTPENAAAKLAIELFKQGVLSGHEPTWVPQ